MRRSTLHGLLFAGFLFLIAVIAERTVPQPGIGVALMGELSGVQDRQLDLVIDLSKIFMNWTFVVIGANSFFLKAQAEAKVALQTADLLLVQVAIGTAILSLLFGHMVITNVITLLEVDQFRAGNILIARYMTAQYWALISSLVLTVVAVHRFYWRGHE
jgi:hypothetical protein